MQTIEALRNFAQKAIETGKYVGGTAGAVKVVLKELSSVMRPDESQELDYLRENIESLLQRSGKAWETPTFNVYVTTFRRLVDDYITTAANVYKLRDPRPRMARPSANGTSVNGSGLNGHGSFADKAAPAAGQRALTLPLPEGGLSLVLNGRISLSDWEHAKKIMDEQVRYILQVSSLPEAVPAEL